jgi:hypothetical protein
VSYLGYRNPRGNRVTAWLDDLCRWRFRISARDPEGGDALCREVMLQSAFISGFLVIFFAAVIAFAGGK